MTRILHVLDHSLPLRSGYTFRTRAILKAQETLGLEVRAVTGQRQQLEAPTDESAETFAKRQLGRLEDDTRVATLLTRPQEDVLIQAAETVLTARRFLKHSYVASFGLKEDPVGLCILENHQAALEIFTERLSHLTETNLQELCLGNTRRYIHNHFRGLEFYSVSVVNYMRRFVEHTLT